jgi:hypothetical protein
MIRGQLVTNGDRNRLCPVMNAELGQDVLDVLPHGLGAYDELFRDLGLAKPLDEERDDVELPPRQLMVRPSVRERSSEEPSHASEQLVGIERLHEVVVAADEEAGHPIAGLRASSREEDDRQCFAELVLELAADLVAGYSRQEHLEDDERGPLPLGRSERLLATLSLVGGVTDPLEHARDERAGVAIAVNDKDRGRSDRVPLPSPPEALLSFSAVGGVLQASFPYGLRRSSLGRTANARIRQPPLLKTQRWQETSPSSGTCGEGRYRLVER